MMLESIPLCHMATRKSLMSVPVQEMFLMALQSPQKVVMSFTRRPVEPDGAPMMATHGHARLK